MFFSIFWEYQQNLVPILEEGFGQYGITLCFYSIYARQFVVLVDYANNVFFDVR